jgi:hypothetical protein
MALSFSPIDCPEINFWLKPQFVSLICMKTTPLLLILLILQFTTLAQHNFLVLQKKHKSFRSYYAGHYLTIETVDKNYADGVISKISQDTVYLRHFDVERSVTDYGGVYFDTAFRYTTAIHYKDIAAILYLKNAEARRRNGTILLIAGGGVLLLGAVNGLYRGDPPKDWYKPSGYIVAGTLSALGIWLRRSAITRYAVGKKYQLSILSLNTP